jgi:predicted O-linked N-acetylglucosamine transferase (SPINDLY family)
MISDKAKLADYYNNFNHIDIHIDSFPYSGTTTTCSSMLMGLVPFTLQGDTHVSRVSSSIILNTSLELKDHVSSDEKDFLENIQHEIDRVRLAKQGENYPTEEMDKRKKIREKFLHEMDCERYTREFEETIRGIYSTKDGQES